MFSMLELLGRVTLKNGCVTCLESEGHLDAAVEQGDEIKYFYVLILCICLRFRFPLSSSGFISLISGQKDENDTVNQE